MARGGKREGAGRPTGSNWKPSVKALRHDAVEKAIAIVGTADDPLTTVASWVMDQKLDADFRIRAAACCLPYLYPRLSASQVDARLSVTQIDPADLLRRIDARVSRMARPQPVQTLTTDNQPTINIVPNDEVEAE